MRWSGTHAWSCGTHWVVRGDREQQAPQLSHRGPEEQLVLLMTVVPVGVCARLVLHSQLLYGACSSSSSSSMAWPVPPLTPA
jgi:hypothetical protein